MDISALTNIHERLQMAVSSEDTTSAENILQTGEFPIDQYDEKGYTLMHLACCKGQLNMVKLLFKYGSDINKPCLYNNSPLHYAVVRSSMEVVKFLLHSGADANACTPDGNTPLHYAIALNYLEFAEILLKNNADSNLMNSMGETPIIISAYNLDIPMTQLLISHGADTNYIKKTGGTMLHCALNGPVNRSEITDFLVRKQQMDSKVIPYLEFITKQEIDINATDEKGNTILHLACAREDITLVKLLMSRKADVNCRNHHGNTAALITCRLDWSELQSQTQPQNENDIKQERLKNPMEVVNDDLEVAEENFPVFNYLSSEQNAHIKRLRPKINAINAAAYHMSRLIWDHYVSTIDTSVQSSETLLEEESLNHNQYENEESEMQEEIEVSEIEAAEEKKNEQKNEEEESRGKGNVGRKNRIEVTKEDRAPYGEWMDLLYINEDPFYSEEFKELVRKYSVEDLLVSQHIGNLRFKTREAIDLRKTQIMNILIQNHADVNVCTPQGDSALRIAVGNSMLHLSKLLIENNAQVNDETEGRFETLSLLALACYHNNHALIKLLLDHGAYFTESDNLWGEHLYIMSSPSLLKQMIELGIVQADGTSHWRRKVSLANQFLLSQSNSAPEAANGNTEILVSQTHLSNFIAQGLLESVKVLLESNIQLQRENEMGANYLHYAAYHPLEDMIGLIHSYSPTLINQKDIRGFTPVFIAVQRGLLNNVTMLCSLGASLTERCNQGRTVLHYAALGNNVELIQFLYNSSPENLSILDNYDASSLHYAMAEMNNTAVVQFLTGIQDIDLSAKDKDGWTPNEIARVRGREDLITLLTTKRRGSLRRIN